MSCLRCALGGAVWCFMPACLGALSLVAQCTLQREEPPRLE